MSKIILVLLSFSISVYAHATFEVFDTEEQVSIVSEDSSISREVQIKIVSSDESEEDHIATYENKSETDQDDLSEPEFSSDDLYAKVHVVPFFSQFDDVSAVQWKKVACGVASLAMLIDYYQPDTVSVDKLLDDGLEKGAYLSDAGWIHSGLINLSHEFGLDGESYSLSGLSMDNAFSTLMDVLEEGPVMASVHYTFEPTNPIPHLVVVNGVRDGKVFYNDPAEAGGGGSISIEKFKRAWKKRYIEIRPVL